MAMQDTPLIESVADWERLPVEEKKTALSGILELNRRDVEIASILLQERDRNQCRIEISYLEGLLGSANSNDELTSLIARIAVMEDALAAIMPSALRAYAEGFIASLEKGLKFAPGMLPPDKVLAASTIVEDARKRLPEARSRREYERLLAELGTAREILETA